MPPQVKICGITDGDALNAALRCGADMLGFLHHPASARHIDPDGAARLRASVGARARVVAVGVDMSDALLEELFEKLRPDFFQLHGSETPQRAGEIRERFGSGIIKAIRVRGNGDIEQAHAFEDAADMLLFDSYTEALAGGTGVVFDWTLLHGLRNKGAWILSGGLTPENVADAIEQTGAPAVDVSSGVESAPGRKDPKKIERFLQAVKTTTPMALRA
ncbi:MAG: phosphoribosylanthranilate isomerase [Hyphomicrobiales bacterium]|nr:phosphoribosylanthranilate isomerase [Hyphomicrobiales bacterium]